jgi:hypothetical protein
MSGRYIVDGFCHLVGEHVQLYTVDKEKSPSSKYASILLLPSSDAATSPTSCSDDQCSGSVKPSRAGLQLK